MEFKEILFQVEGGIATMTLNRADTRNVITHPDMIAEIQAVTGDTVKAVEDAILTRARQLRIRDSNL